MINQKPIIYFDMDGVLADMQGMMDKYGIKYNSPTEHDPVVDQNMWDEVRKIDHFYDKLKPVEGSVELFNNLSAKYECQILTAIPKEKWNIPDAKEDKINWAKRYLGDDVKINTVYRPEKKDFVKGSQSILVDDLPQNIQEWEAEGGTGILFIDSKSFNYDKLNKTILDFRMSLLGKDSKNEDNIEKGDAVYDQISC